MQYLSRSIDFALLVLGYILVIYFHELRQLVFYSIIRDIQRYSVLYIHVYLF